MLAGTIGVNFYETMNENPNKNGSFNDNYSLEHVDFPNVLIRNLQRYSPIKNMRIKRGYRLQKIKDGFAFDDIGYEFFVDEQWLRWHELSDGTKRIFYIIAEVTAATEFSGPIFIEEPELGLHPDQVFRIMDFLKETTEDKQIIITTHAPMVLDILEHDELNRILITGYDKEKGTTIRRLTNEQIEAAQNYMDAEGLWLRDYWINSDLEGAIV